ncbi:hypothetical protein [Paenarthrobacter aurescens]|nr:hypothetical protein [Paenarthrobacter aurescens]
MKSRSREHLIGLVLCPVLMLGLSACLPPSTDGLSPGSNPASPPAAPEANASASPNSTTANSTSSNSASQDTPAQDTSASAPTTQEASTQTQPAGVDPTGSSSISQQPGESTGPVAAPQEPTVVSWLPTGPIGSGDPVPGQRYLLLQQLQCDALAEHVEGASDAALWLAGAAVCRALQTGSQEDWQRASIAVATTPRVSQRQCLEFRVAATLTSVVAQHRRSPGSVFTADPAPGEACPRQLLGLTVVDEDLRPLIGGPRASGPRTGGTIVRLDGYYVRVGAVLFDGVPAVPDIVAGGGDYQALYLRMPPADGRDTLRISITDTVEVAGTVTFFYDDPAVSSSTPHPSEAAGTPPDNESDNEPANGPPSEPPNNSLSRRTGQDAPSLGKRTRPSTD